MNVSIPSSSKKLSERNFTHLKVQIVEEDGAFTVRVRLLNEVDKNEKTSGEESASSGKSTSSGESIWGRDSALNKESAWGEEIAATFDQASAMIDALAAEFSIPPAFISIKIVMSRFQDGTMH